MTTTSRRPWGFAVIIVCALLTTMCGGPPTASVESRSTLRIAPQAGLSGLDPQSGKAIIDLVVSSQLYDTLVVFDENQTPQPGLATAWTQVDDTTWEITLRENIKFHDGTDFHAEAVKYNIERAIDPDRAGRSTLFKPFISGATVINPRTVRITTNGVVPYVPYILGSGFLGIVSPTAADRLGPDLARNPVGTGPFKFVKWDENQLVEMEANDDYWNGRPTLAGITWRLIPSESARAVALQAGEVNVIASPPTDLIPSLVDSGNYNMINRPTNAFVGIWTNPEVPALNDVTIRLAIFHSIDQFAIVDNIFKGVAQPAYQLLGPAVFGMFSDEQVPEGGFYPYDPELSKQLLAEAGWVDSDGDGRVDRAGQKLTVSVQTPEGRYLKDRQVAEAAVAYMQAVGIDAVLKVVEFPTHSTGVTQHQVEVFLLSWSFPDGYPEPSFYSVFHTSEGGGQATWAQWKNPAADALMDRARNEPDADVRRQLYQQIMTIFMDNAVIKPIYREPILYLMDKSVENFVVMPNSLPAKMVTTNVQ